VDTLDEALALQNATAFGLTGGLHSLDDNEIEQWLAAVEVGNAYVNRHITGAIVQRQPFGGWKDSVVGPGAKAGGPNYVAQLGTWMPDGTPAEHAQPAPRVRQTIAEYLELIPSESDRAWLRAAVGSDAAAWASELGQEIDRTGLTVESNVLRYRPLPTLVVRAGRAASPVEVVRVVIAAQLAGTLVSVSVDPAESPSAAPRIPNEIVDIVETTGAFVDRVRAGTITGRIRVVGDENVELLRELAGEQVTVVAGPVLASGRRELLNVLREQAISRTLHRFGHLQRHADA
jgi:RHH-type proline utilization regulon transcriptional repressor/proline dehydrogenase/delta 1-pyrroline-5-carboxylate dehydrogenase